MINFETELLLVDKPSGMTSFDVIRFLRKEFFDTGRRELDEIQGVTEKSLRDVFSNTVNKGLKQTTQKIANSRPRAPKMGHAGTLDPLATGLMLIGVGPGTKKLNDYIKLDKEYVAEVMVGESRTTGDMEGEVIESVEAVEISQSEISTAVSQLVGTIKLPVSAYSAIKKDGVPMYKRARAAAKLGEVVKDVPWREMTIHEAEIEDIYVKEIDSKKRMIVKVRFFVASGTYIRSLAEEIGRHLGYPACLYSLRRTKVGKFTVAEAIRLK